MSAGPALEALHAGHPLLSPEGATDLLRRSGVAIHRAVPDYVRLKPGAGILVGYRLRGHGPGAEGVELPGYVRTVEPERAAAVAQKWAAMRPTSTPLGPGFRLLADDRSVLFLFPNDAQLRQLKAVSGRDKLKRLLAELPELAGRGLRVRGKRSVLAPVRYKPERRFIASADLELTDGEQRSHLAAFVRLFPDARGAGIAETAEAVRSAAGASLLPRPLGTLLAGRLFVEERVVGPELLQAVLDGAADGTAVAAAVHRMHAVPPPPRLPRRTASSIAAGLQQGLTTMAAVAPSLRPAVAAVVTRLRRWQPDEEAALMHGDLHLHQVILGADGPTLVDLERAAVGNPMQDLAELLAHLDEVARCHPEARQRVGRFREQVLETALPAVRSPHADEALRFFFGAALANRALLPFRRVDEGWVKRSEGLLERAAKALAAA